MLRTNFVVVRLTLDSGCARKHTDKDNIIITRIHTWLGSVKILRKVGIVVFFAFLAFLL